jgi:hypothetical protein
MSPTFLKKSLIVLSVLACLTASYDLLSSRESARGASQTVAQASLPENLNGKWHQTKGMKGVTMDAVITGDSIQVNMTLDDSTGPFWMGSFDQSRQPAIISIGDVDAMANKIFASNETTKTFTYKNGDLSFDFSMMGVHTTVHMSKGTN